MMFRHSLNIAVCALALASTSTLAHHSRAAYDMTREVVLEGTVVELAWKNPHIFMTVETETDGESSRVEVEVASISEARALGLTREAIAPGASVVTRVHPGRRTPMVSAVGLDVKAADGIVYPLNTDAGLALPAREVEAESLAGHWAPTLESFNNVFPATRSWPFTAAGLAVVQDTVRKIDAEPFAFLGICEPFPPPTLSIFPDLRTIEVADTTITMQFEGGVGVTMNRVIHLDQSEHAPGVAPSLMGHSIGRWEGDTLVIDTVGFAPHAVGALIFPTGSGKHLVERFTLAANRLSLEYVFTLEDPELLAAPVTYTATWSHRPDLEFTAGETCDSETARRPLEE